MRKTHFLLSILIFFSFQILAQQEERLAMWYEWTDSAAFAVSPEPIMKEEGPLSDSLSEAYSFRKVFIANNQYYIINSVSDYYLWFLDRYPKLFTSDASKYHQYYEDRNDLGMYDYVMNNYVGKRLPLAFDRTFTGYDRQEAEDYSEKYKDEKEESWRRWRQDQLEMEKALSRRPASTPAAAPKPKSAPAPKLKKVGSN